MVKRSPVRPTGASCIIPDSLRFVQRNDNGSRAIARTRRRENGTLYRELWNDNERVWSKTGVTYHWPNTISAALYRAQQRNTECNVVGIYTIRPDTP